MFRFQVISQAHVLFQTGLCPTKEEAIEIGLRYVNLYKNSILLVEAID